MTVIAFWDKHKKSAGDTGSTAKRVAYADEDCPDSPDFVSSVWLPSWKDPENIKRYLVLGDSIERDLVEYLLRTASEIAGLLPRSVECDDAEQAGGIFGDALELTRSFFQAVLSLNRYRKGGVQEMHVVRTSGIHVGVQAKIESLMKPRPGSPDALLLEDLKDLAWRFEVTSDRFKSKANSTEAWVGEETYRRRQELYGLTVPTHKEAARWHRLASKAHTEQGKILELLTKLSKGKRQVMVIEESKVEPPKGAVPDAVAKGAKGRAA
jgi:hypothetical protein